MIKKFLFCILPFVIFFICLSNKTVDACPITRGTIDYLPTYGEFSHYTGKWTYSGEIEVVCPGTTEPVEQRDFIEFKLDENGYGVDCYRLSYVCQ